MVALESLQAIGREISQLIDRTHSNSSYSVDGLDEVPNKSMNVVIDTIHHKKTEKASHDAPGLRVSPWRYS